MDLIGELQKKNQKDNIPAFEVGDTVDVEVRITEGEKERTQIFTGVVIAKKNGGVNACFTVRRIVQGEGVERVFPIHSPKVSGVRVKRHGRVRQAKLYYLRGRTGKSARIAEKRPAGAGRAKKAPASPKK